MSKPSPEEASPAGLTIKLPSDIKVKLSEDELRCFYSWSEAQQQLFLKQARVIPSVSATASVADVGARFGLNRKVAPEGGQNRKGYVGPLKKAIVEIRKDLIQNDLCHGRLEFDDLLELFKEDAATYRCGRDSLISDLRKAGIVSIQVQEVDERNEFIYYRLLSGAEQDPVAFKTIKNILSHLNKCL